MNNRIQIFEITFYTMKEQTKKSAAIKTNNIAYKMIKVIRKD